MILNVQGGEVSKDSLTQIILDLLELRDELAIPMVSSFYTISNWKSVTITYKSDVKDFQSKELVFNINHPETQTVLNDNFRQYFAGNPVVSAVTIYDFANGFLKYSSNEHDLSFLNVELALQTAPSSIFYESTDGVSGKIPVEEIASWEVGWKVRIYDILNQRYMDPDVSIASLDGTTGLVTLSSPISVEPNVMVLKSPNNTKFEVKVDNSGVISTVLTSLDETERFNIQEQRTDVKWVIKVDNSGTLYIETAVAGDLDLVTANDYLLRSPNGNGWKLLIVPVAYWQTIPGPIVTSRFSNRPLMARSMSLLLGMMVCLIPFLHQVRKF